MELTKLKLMQSKTYSQFVLLALYQYCIFTTILLVMSANTNLSTDQSALLEFKTRYITSDPVNMLRSNWSTSTSACNWVGVTCGLNNTRVVSLNLSNMSLVGTIPPHLGNLTSLTSFDISSNQFEGYLPEELSNLQSLQVFNIFQNKFNGEVQSWFGNISSIETLNLSSNNFIGSIPVEISNLQKLKVLGLSYNNLEGSMPSTLFNISSLRVMDFTSTNLSGNLPDDMCTQFSQLDSLSLSLNQFSGPIPTGLGHCRRLQILSLSYNRFSGSIPKSIGNLTLLKELNLGHTNLEGEIPGELGNLVNLETLKIQQLSGITGSVPPSIFNISSLQTLGLANNSLTGTLPDDLCRNLPSLNWLDLRNNNITGTIPRSIGNCSALQYLFLFLNNFEGEIPSEIGDLPLEYLVIGWNNFVGTVPSRIFNMSTVLMIQLSFNNLSGNLPESIGKQVTNLEQLLLSRNQFTGTIPPSISNASNLYLIELSFNSFSGPIPTELGYLKNLQTLNLGENYLTIASSSSFFSSLANCVKLERLGLENNPLNITLPSSFGNLSADLEYIFMYNSQLRGNIPVEIGNISNVFIINLSSNQLTGSIPWSFGNLHNLQSFSLGENSLEGMIPNDICKLQFLGGLWLSNNNLQGQIPQCFSNLTSLKYLYLDSNKLSAEIPTTLWSIQYILELSLVNNSLSGSLPLSVGNLEAVTAFDLSSNHLSGNLPSSIGQLQDLVYLSIAKNGFEGSIPESIGNLKSLETLDLSNNYFSGQIPTSLKELSFLKNFNVSFNSLQGAIPDEGPFTNLSAQSFMSNLALCGSSQFGVPPCKDDTTKRSKATKLLLKILLPSLASVILVTAVTIIIIKRWGTLSTQHDVPGMEGWQLVTFYELQKATDGFSKDDLLGAGSFGSVYRGKLSDGRIVAVKVFNTSMEESSRSFATECEVMANTRHRNLVKIISWCSEPKFKALVLEFMENGSLEHWLYSTGKSLDVLQRLNIMIDVASALDYLHQGCSLPMVHCDLKPSNILLDEDMVAHVADFGLTKLLNGTDSVTQTMTLATIGYMAPEYGSRGIVSTKGDVYSFGIVLIETFTRRKPTDEMFAGENNLKNWVKESVPDRVMEVMDEYLTREDTEGTSSAAIGCMLSILLLALACCEQSPDKRMKMNDVQAALHKIKATLLPFY